MTIKRIAFVFGLFLIIAQSTMYAADDKMATLREYQDQQLASLALKLKLPGAIELLYVSTGTGKMPILVLQEHSNIHSIQELQKLFEIAKLVTKNFEWMAWSQEDWNLAMASLNERKNRTKESLKQLRKKVEEKNPKLPELEEEEEEEEDEDVELLRKIVNERSREKIPFSYIKPLRDDALILLESFLPPEHNDLDDLLKNDAFIPKIRAEHRLYTYTKIYETIKAKNLNHIRLPLKFLIMKDKKTDTYITDPNKIKEVLRKRIKTFVFDPTMLELSFLLDDQDDDYSFHIVAERVIDHKILSSAAFQDLELLVEDAPFDIGYDNIFADEQGDAVIIDTEYKGTRPDEAKAKLKRYNTSGF